MVAHVGCVVHKSEITKKLGKSRTTLKRDLNTLLQHKTANTNLFSY